MLITYDAKRSLIPGVLEGDIVNLTISPTEFDRSVAQSKTEVESKSGVRQSVELYFKESFSILGEPVADATLDEWRMFLDSTRNGEPYLIEDIDFGGSITVKTIGSYSPSRYNKGRVGFFGYEWRAVQV